MSDIAGNKTTKDMLDRGHNFAMFGLIISLLAFSFSVSTPWILDAFAPPTAPIEDVAVEKAVHIKDRILEAVTWSESEDIVQADPEAEGVANLADYWSLIVVMIALGGIVNGVLGYVRKETRIVGGAAVLIGVTAIIVQYLLIALVALVLVILIVGILNSFGVSF